MPHAIAPKRRPLSAGTRATLEAQFNALYRIAAARLYRYCLAQLRKESDAEDMVQESFAKIWEVMRKRRKTVKPNAVAYLFRIAQNAIVSRYRRNSPLLFEDSLEILEENFRFEIPLREEILEALGEEYEKEFSALFENLSPEQQQVFVLHVFENLSYKTIGAILHKKTDTVRMLFYRARQKIRAAYETQRKETALRGRFSL